MQNILLVDDEEDILGLLSEWLYDELDDIRITFAKNGFEAIEKLESDTDFDLIICDYYMPNSNGAAVFSYNYDNKNLPFIFLTGAFIEDLTSIKNLEVDNKRNFIVLKPYDEESFLKKIKAVLSGDFLKEKSYKKTKISLLKKFSQSELKLDVFYKLSEEKYLKILDSDNPLDISVIKKYAKKGEEFLFLREEDFQMLNFMLEDLLLEQLENSKIDRNDSETKDKTLQILPDVFEYVHTGLYGLGIGQRQIELVDKSIKTCLEEIRSNERLFPYIANLVETNNFIISHGVMTAHFSSLLAIKMGFKSYEILTKLTYASLFQNIVLNEELLAKVTGEDSEDFKALSRSDQKRVSQHPTEAARIIETCSFLSADIITLVEKHHEKPDGSGFPRKVTGNYINSLSSIFNLAVVISDFICKNGFDESQHEVLVEKLEKDYNKSMFKKPLNCFLELLSAQKH